MKFLTYFIAVLSACCIPMTASAQFVSNIEERIGDTFPEFSNLNQDNILKTNADYEGKVVLMHICTAWCIRCQEAAKNHRAMVDELNIRIGADKFAFVDFLMEQPSGALSIQSTAQGWANFTDTPAEILHMNGIDPGITGVVAFSAISDGASLSLELPTSYVIGLDGVVSFVQSGWLYDPDQPLANSAETFINAIVAAADTTTEIEIDIKPGNDDNLINLSSSGVIPIAILSSPEFDAPAEIDPASIVVAGASVKILGNGSKYSCSSDDVNDDGLKDLKCKIYTEGFMIEPGADLAVMDAETFSGQAVTGSDLIVVVETGADGNDAPRAQLPHVNVPMTP